MRVSKVRLAEPRGFCAGVEMAIKALSWMVRIFEAPVYCYHEIVHNAIVVEAFEELGVVFVDDVAEVPPNRPVMLSAHGSAPQVEASAGEADRFVVDACCPLVTKVHHEMKVRARKGYTVIYVGHEGHQETIGTMAVAPGAVRLVQQSKDVAALEINAGEPVALLAQTTLAHEEWADIVDEAKSRFPELWMPGRSDLCYATTNRQAAVRAMAPGCDAVIVIGSANSSNTLSLAKTATTYGCPRVHRVNSLAELPDDLEGIIGVTAGASAPEWLVSEVLHLLAPEDGIELVHVTAEDEYFPPPPELRDVLRSAAAAASLLAGAPADRLGPTAEDRATTATSILRPGHGRGSGGRIAAEVS
ncbi:MAG: 4-hydroxy-3-methylbut-2-enyl diphosphate reductase [Acidimicrobiales bacterium]